MCIIFIIKLVVLIVDCAKRMPSVRQLDENNLARCPSRRNKPTVVCSGAVNAGSDSVAQSRKLLHPPLEALRCCWPVSRDLCASAIQRRAST